MSLIQRILEYVEEEGEGDGRILDLPAVPGYAQNEVRYHAWLAMEAGYVHYQQGDMTDLTWEGHEALDRLRAARG